MRQLEGQYKDALDKVTRNELLLTETPGYVGECFCIVLTLRTLEADGPLEKTYKFSQAQIKEAVDLQSSSKVLLIILFYCSLICVQIFDLDLHQFGPYKGAYQRNGRHLLLAGRKGHVAMMDWTKNRVLCELYLNEVSFKFVTSLHSSFLDCS